MEFAISIIVFLFAVVFFLVVALVGQMNRVKRAEALQDSAEHAHQDLIDRYTPLLREVSELRAKPSADDAYLETANVRNQLEALTKDYGRLDDENKGLSERLAEEKRTNSALRGTVTRLTKKPAKKAAK